MPDTPANPAVYQVWHDRHWPESRLGHVPGGGPEPPFPQGYTHVANVRAASLAQAAALTTDKGGILDGADWQPWEKNAGVEALARAPRDTTAGDVIVDPQGKAHRVEREGFKEIGPAAHPGPAPGHPAERDAKPGELRPQPPPAPERVERPGQEVEARKAVHQMLNDVEAVTKARFYEDPDPVASPVEMFRMPDGEPGGQPFAALTVREKVQVLGDYTRWQDYEKQGVNGDQLDQVFWNVIQGKPRQGWLEGTGLAGPHAPAQEPTPMALREPAGSADKQPARQQEKAGSTAEKLMRVLTGEVKPDPRPAADKARGPEKDRGIDR